MFCCCSRACCQQGILWTTLCPQRHSSNTSKLSGLCISNIFHINSFCSQNLTEQFTVINLWPLLHVVNPSFMWHIVWIGVYSICIQPPEIFFLYLLIYLLLWKLHRRCKFVRTKRSGNKLGLSTGLLESSTENLWIERRNSPADEVSYWRTSSACRGIKTDLLP